MTMKGVFASLGFSVYVTKHDLELLLQQGTITGPAFLGKIQVNEAEVTVILNPILKGAMTQAYAYERDIVDKAKEQIASGYLGRERKGKRK